MHTLIGISGYKGSGKDFFATFMNERGGYKIVHFAHRLKEICAQVFNHNIEEYYSNSAKERQYTNGDEVVGIEIDDYLNQLREVTGLMNMEPYGKVAYSHRQLLQYVGTEYVRNANSNYWVEYLTNKVLSSPGKYLVPDTRFPNEVQALKDIGGITVMVHRPDAMIKSDGHASENMDGIKGDINLHIVCKTGDMEVLKAARDLLKGDVDLSDIQTRLYAKGTESYGI